MFAIVLEVCEIEVIIMMGKVDKITKVTGVKLDVNSPWLQRRQRDGQGDEESFREALQGSMARRARRSAAPAMSSEAAVWEGNSATQSLFYENGVNLDFFYRNRAGIA